MERKILLKISPSITESMINLLDELDKAGIFKEGFLVYDEEHEAVVKEILKKYQ